MSGSRIPIVRDPEVCSGHPVLAGTRSTVHSIVSYVKLYDGDMELAQEEALPHLPLEVIHDVMAWYSENTAEIDDILRSRQEDYERGVAEAKGLR